MKGCGAAGPAVAFVAWLALGACTGRAAEPPPIIPLPDNLAPPTDALEVRLRERAPTEAALLVPNGPPFRATLAAGEHGSFTSVLRAGVCYKVLGGAEETVTDLDVLVYDPNNVLRQRDATASGELVIGTERGICPSEAGAWRFEVGVAAGHGAVIAQLWRMPM